MHMRAIVLSFIIIAACFLVAGQSGAAERAFAGDILSVKGSVTIVKDSGRIEALKGDQLSVKDQLLIEHGAEICIRMPMKQSCLGHTNSPYIVPPVKNIKQTDNRPNLFFLFSESEKRIMRFETKARTGAETREAIGDSSLIPSAAKDDTQIQYVPRGTRFIAILYKGSADAKRWIGKTSSGRAQKFEFDPKAMILNFDAGIAEEMTIYGSGTNGNEISFWTIKPADSVPAPDETNISDLSDEDRLERAIWLLREQPSWRIYALTELATLADKNTPNARDALEIAQSDGCIRKRGPSCPYMN